MQGKHLAVGARAADAEEELVQQHAVFPTGPLLGAAAFAAAYAYTSHVIVLGPAVPIINACGLAALAVYVARTLRK